jgi:hypothetical protein
MSTQNYNHRPKDEENNFLSYEEQLAKESLYVRPTFGYYRNLVNETAPDQFSEMNEWFFTEFSKISLIKFGFVSFIRYLHEDVLYLKLYYLSDTIRDSKREIDDFVCTFYAHEKFELKYSKCNILHIHLKGTFSAKCIENQTTIKALESLLQSRLNDESWVGVFSSGTMGAYTNFNPNKPFSIYNRWKSLLFEGYLEPEYEEGLKQEEMESNSQNDLELQSASGSSMQEIEVGFLKQLKEATIMKKEKDTLTQNQELPQRRSGKYSDVMAWMDKMLLSKNHITKEQPTKVPQTKKDNTIKVTFFRQITKK